MDSLAVPLTELPAEPAAGATQYTLRLVGQNDIGPTVGGHGHGDQPGAAH